MSILGCWIRGRHSVSRSDSNSPNRKRNPRKATRTRFQLLGSCRASWGGVSRAMHLLRWYDNTGCCKAFLHPPTRSFMSVESRVAGPGVPWNLWRGPEATGFQLLRWQFYAAGLLVFFPSVISAAAQQPNASESRRSISEVMWGCGPVGCLGTIPLALYVGLRYHIDRSWLDSPGYAFTLWRAFLAFWVGTANGIVWSLPGSLFGRLVVRVLGVPQLLNLQTSCAHCLSFGLLLNSCCPRFAL